MKIATHENDLTYDQWRRVRRFLPTAENRGRPRTFGWLMHCRRWMREHEPTTGSSAGWIYFALIRLMLRRLA